MTVACWWPTVTDGKYALGAWDWRGEKQRTRSSLRSLLPVKWVQFQSLPAHISSGPFSPCLGLSVLGLGSLYVTTRIPAISMQLLATLRSFCEPKYPGSFISPPNFPFLLSHSLMFLLEGPHLYKKLFPPKV